MLTFAAGVGGGGHIVFVAHLDQFRKSSERVGIFFCGILFYGFTLRHWPTRKHPIILRIYSRDFADVFCPSRPPKGNLSKVK